MDNIAVFLSSLAALLHVIAFAIYNKKMLEEKSCPNTATWTLWSFLTILNVSSYWKMSGDLIKSLLPFASSAACILTYLFCLYKGKMNLKETDIYDKLSLVAGIVAGIVWWYYKSATCGNLILQAAIIISFVPMWKMVWRKPSKESALPWYIWSLAYVLSIVVVILRWNGQYRDLVYPVICFLLHLSVGLLTKRK